MPAGVVRPYRREKRHLSIAPRQKKKLSVDGSPQKGFPACLVATRGGGEVNKDSIKMSLYSRGGGGGGIGGHVDRLGGFKV